MELSEYLTSRQASQAELARELQVTPGFIWQAIAKKRPWPAHLAVRIERWSGGAVTRADLRDDWQSIWPEYSPPSAESAA